MDLLTREYPPNVYGGAGVHVSELSAVLRSRVDVRVRCFDGPRGAPEPRPGVQAYSVPPGLEDLNPALAAFGTDLRMAQDCAGTDIVHSHTWYANLAGHLAGLLHGVPHVVSAHSLEPLRPWKVEQLAGGYGLSSWVERAAYEAAAAIIAVSARMRQDILSSYPGVDPARVHVVHNGVDVRRWRRPEGDAHELAAATVRGLGIDPDRPTVVFVGRITRQKGLPHLVRAAASLPREVQVVLCAGAPDTPEDGERVATAIHSLQQARDGVVWIQRMLPRDALIAVLACATVFACPSIYEPLGIVNLEAMAVGLPVVGTHTGGIPEVVEDGVTGWLVPIDQAGRGVGEPVDPDVFVADLAAALRTALSDPDEAAHRGRAARERVERLFSWDAIAERTLQVYDTVLAEAPGV